MKTMKKLFALLMCAALLLSCGLVSVLAEDATPTDATPDTPAVASAAQGSFTFANFNIAGLPSLSASSEKAARQKEMGRQVAADDYDIVAVQEDFSYDADFSSGLNMPYRTNGSQNVVTGDGLEIFSKTPVYNVSRQGWNKKGGMLWEGDIVSQKGVMCATVELEPGVYVDVYNLHGDAFDGQESRDARHDNFMQTLNFVNANSKDHAVIITGDFNSAFHFTNGEGADLYNIFIEQLGMKDVWTEVVNGGSFTDYSAYSGVYYWGNWDSVECILYRNSDTVTLTPTSHKFIRYADESGAFSDHATAVAAFDYSASALASSDGLTPAKKEALNPLKLMQVVFADLKYVFTHFDELTAMLKYRDDMEYLYTNYSR